MDVLHPHLALQHEFPRGAFNHHAPASGTLASTDSGYAGLASRGRLQRGGQPAALVDRPLRVQLAGNVRPADQVSAHIRRLERLRQLA
jgi:hypothetical protein